MRRLDQLDESSLAGVICSFHQLMETAPAQIFNALIQYLLPEAESTYIGDVLSRDWKMLIK